MHELMQWWIMYSEPTRNAGILLGGGFGLFLAWRRVRAANKQADAQIRQAELDRRGHVAELFNRAVGQMKDEKLEVRLGALLMMGQILSDFPDLGGPTRRLLATFMRENHVVWGDNEPPADILEIMRILRGPPEELQ